MSAETEKLAIELDEALTDPEAVRKMSQLLAARGVPDWIDLDDLADLVETNDLLMRTLSEADRGELAVAPPREVPDWLRLGMLSAFTQWVAGEAQTCEHDPRWNGPIPGMAVAWKPGVVACPSCLELHDVSEVENRRCDCCGRITEPGEGIRPITLSTGILWYRAGACNDCFPFDLAERLRS